MCVCVSPVEITQQAKDPKLISQPFYMIVNKIFRYVTCTTCSNHNEKPAFLCPYLVCMCTGRKVVNEKAHIFCG